MKRRYIALLVLLCMLSLFVGLRTVNRVAQLRGQEDGYREGYLAGQADRENNREYDPSTPGFRHDLRGVAARHHHAYRFYWPSGYEDGWDDLPPSFYVRGKPLDLTKTARWIAWD